jgi:putative nucleotidyltransferase with HDIG domain
MLLAAGADTARHSRDVERIALGIADRLGLSGEERQNVAVAARLHDIGKVAIPRALLEKVTPPTMKEWELIYDHTVIGERILRSVEELRAIATLVRHSHERWDGTGYPDGLRGLEIPLASRIIFCADAFHAICTDRPYREGHSMAAALAEIRRCAGTQFEPRVVAALTRVVRDDIYGASGRPRRRSHARLSMLLVIALSLGGSIAGGMAASRDALAPDQDPASPSATAPALIPGAVQLAPGSGSVAGAVAKAKAKRDGATGLEAQGTGGAPEQSDQTPDAPSKPSRSTGTEISAPIRPPTVPVPSVRPLPGIGSRLGISPGTGDGGETESDGGGSTSGQKPPDEPPSPGDDGSSLPLG